MIPERCGPPPTQTARPGGLGSAEATLGSADELAEPPDEPESCFKAKWHFFSHNLKREIIVAKFALQNSKNCFSKMNPGR